MLRGRRAECLQLDDLVAAVRQGSSRTLVISGQAGVGKTALLEHLLDAAADCRTVTVSGMEAEAEFAFAALHQVCTPFLDQLGRIPAPQREALSTAFGLRTGVAPDRFMLGLATLSLLADAAGDGPLICVIDDAQWLDQASKQVLAFVARRLMAEPIGLVFALREPSHDDALSGLPQLRVHGLRPAAARELLATTLPGPLDARVRDRIVAETGGNPLALLELPQGMSYAELAGGFDLIGSASIPARIETSFRHRLAPLTPQVRRLLLVAAIEPSGDATVVRRAARQLDIEVDVIPAASFGDLMQIDHQVTFRHPLVRSAVYREASAHERRRTHRALAEVTDPVTSADQRAWHMGQAADGPDESVAAELERCAGSAQIRGGLAAAAAFLDRAARLTPGGANRTRRSLATAELKLRIGDLDATLALLTQLEQEAVDELQRARIDLLRAEAAFVASRGQEAAGPLLAAARRLEPLDPRLARDTYLDAFSAACFAGRLARTPVTEIAEAARQAPPPSETAPADLLLDALSALFTQPDQTAVPTAQRAIRQLRSTTSTRPEDPLSWLWLAAAIAADLWDVDSWRLFATRYVQSARQSGALSELPLALHTRIVADVFTGNIQTAAELADEATTVADTIQSQIAPYGNLWLAASQGRELDAEALSRATLTEAASRGEGIGISITHASNAVLFNASGQYERALDAARAAADHPADLAATNWGRVELIEAAARLGRLELGTDALVRLAVRTTASGTDWALGVETRCRALLSNDHEAEPLYVEAVDLLDRSGVRADMARARLVYGEWLRRRRRRADARDQLRAAHQSFAAMGAQAFAERARHELMATGAKAPRQQAGEASALTAQEAQIARLARDGLSNPEIGAHLFLSPRTVEWHLGKIFAKLQISSRHELRTVLASVG